MILFQIVYCQFASIFVPVLLSSASIALRDPSIILGESEGENEDFKKGKFGRRLMVVCLSFFNPILLIIKFEGIKAKIIKMSIVKMTDSNVAMIIEKIKRCRHVETELAAFLRLELGTETFYQLTGTTLLLLLAHSNTPTVSGLDTMFRKGDFFGIPATSLLVISILLSLKTCDTVYRKAILVEKSHFPFLSNISILVFGLLGTAQNVIGIVAYFVPFLGLFSILTHWKAEQTTWASTNVTFLEDGLYKSRPLNYSTDTLHLTDGVSLAWSELNRANYTGPAQPTPPPYTFYTGLTLQTAFSLFLFLHTLHLLSVIAVKWLTVPGLTRQKNLLEVFTHGLENMKLPYPVRDWDRGSGGVEEHRLRCRGVAREMLATLAVNLLWGLVLLVPVLYTGFRIKERHALLVHTVGAMLQEDAAHHTATMVALPTFLVLAAIAQAGLFLLYNYRLHPWHQIVSEERISDIFSSPWLSCDELIELPCRDKNKKSSDMRIIL